MPMDLAHNSIFGFYQLGICQCFSGDTSFHKSIKKFSFPKTSVKAIADFGEIGLQMFFRNPTMSPPDDRLDVRDNTVYPRQEPSRSFGISKDNFVMRHITPFCCFSIRSPSIGTDLFQKILPFFVGGSASKSLQALCTSWAFFYLPKNIFKVQLGFKCIGI